MEGLKLENCRKWLWNTQQCNKEPQFLHNPIERKTEGERTEVKKQRLVEGKGCGGLNIETGIVFQQE